MKVCVYMFGQDDPNKYAAAKLVRFGLAEQVRYIGHNTVLLDPFLAKHYPDRVVYFAIRYALLIVRGKEQDTFLHDTEV